MPYFNEQLDYIFFLYGLAFFLLARVCWTLQKQRQCLLPWKWLAWSGLLHGTYAWLTLLTFTMGDATGFAAVRLALLSVSFLLLVEFSRTGMKEAGGRTPGWWIIVPLAALAALGAGDGLGGLAVSVWYVFGLGGGIWAALVLLRASRAQGRSRLYLELSAAVMILYTLLSVLAGPDAAFFAEPNSYQSVFPAGYRAPVQLLSCLLIYVVAGFLWIDFIRARKVSAQKMRAELRSTIVRALIVFMILASGWLITVWIGHRQLAQQQARLFDLAQRSAIAVNSEYIKKLTASADDLNNQNYRRLKEQLITLKDNMPQVRFIYLMQQVNGRVLFLADSEPPGSRDESPPGQVYDEASKELIRLFSSGNTLIEGPQKDRWGTWISVFHPLRDDRTGELIAILGIDQNAREFSAAVALGRLNAIGLTALICSATVLFLLFRRRLAEALSDSMADLTRDQLLRWSPPAVVALVGMAFTLSVFLEMRRYALDLFETTFRQQASVQFEALYKAIDSQLEGLDGLSRFFEASDLVSRTEFNKYAGPMHKQYSVQAMEWIPRVRGPQRAAFELRARQDGLAGFRITEKDAAGNIIPAGARNDYFPVYYIEPLAGNEPAVGFDLASEHIRRAALERSRDEHRTVATAPIQLVQDREKQPAFLAVSPVYEKGAADASVEERREHLQGFVLGVFRLNDLIKSVLSKLPSSGLPFYIEDLSAPPGNRLLYRYWPEAGARDWQSAAAFAKFEMPMEIAGRDWRITVVPDEAFVEHNFSREHWWTLGGGLALTMLFALSALYFNKLITRRFQAEAIARTRAEELQESEKRFQFAVEEREQGIWDWNIDENTVFFSQRWREMLGFSKETVRNSLEEWTQRTHPEDKTKVKQAVERHLREETDIYETEHRVLCGDGTYKWVLDRGKVILRTKDGRPLRMVGTYTDISPHKEAEQKLKEALTELERSNAELQQFAYVASHDLREPLRMIASYLQLLERRYRDRLDADAGDYIAFAVDGAQRMQTLINDLLTYSRVGTKGKDFAPADAAVAVRQALANLQILVEETGARINCGPLPTVIADSSQLAQLFQNLLGNALKYRSGDAPDIDVSAERRGHEWLFAVRDNGIGIDPQYFERIFIIFQRLHSRTEYPGTGIGLAICKKIVERHGGSIRVSSEPGRGSTFFFTIPAAET
jgi:PAS domain S-box-containing protein